MTGVPGATSAIASTAASVSGTLLPQLAPMAASSRGPSRSASSLPLTPIIVQPAVSKLMVTATGRSHARRAARTAASTSSSALIVSIHSRSTPPASSAAACSANAASHASMLMSPSGASSSPVGPIEPATSTGRPDRCVSASASTWPICAAAMLSSRTWRSKPCSDCRKQLPPKLFVTIRSAPACR